MDGVEFLGALSGRLEIELTEPPVAIAPPLLNMKALESASIKTLKLVAEVFENGDFRALTEEELALVVVQAPTIRMVSDCAEDVVVEHAAPNGHLFTVRDMLVAAEETERQARSRSEWFGGIDVHHTYLEGIHQEDDGLWVIQYGS